MVKSHKKKKKTFHGKNRLRRLLSLWSNKILFTARLFQVILEYRQVEKGGISNKMSECSSRNPSAGEEVILKWAQKNLPSDQKKAIEIFNRMPCEFLPTLSCSHHFYSSPIKASIPMNKGSSIWQICFPEWDLMDHSQYLHLNGPRNFLWGQIGTGNSGEHCPHWKADVPNASHESLPQKAAFFLGLGRQLWDNSQAGNT